MIDTSNSISGQKKSEVFRLAVQTIFAGAVIIGSVGIFIGVFFNSVFLSIVFPLAIMAVYIIWMAKSETDLPKSTIGDSYYYLGFIFTLISLVASLMSLSNNDGIEMNAIIGSFGAALMTTIVGLVARLFVTAFSAESKVRRDRLEDELERSITSLSEKLKELTVYTTSSLIEVHAQTEETLKATLLGYQKINEDVANSFEKSMEDGAEGVRTAFDKLAIKVNNVEVNPRPLETTFNDFIKVIEAQRESYQSLNEGIIESNDSLSIQLSGSNSLISDHIEKFENEMTKVISSQAKSYEETLNQIASSIFSSLGDIKDIKLDTKEVAENELLKIGSEISSFTDIILKWKEAVTASYSEFSGVSEVMSTNTDLVDESIKRMNKCIEGFGDEALILKDLRGPVDDLIKLVKDFNVQIEETMTISKVANESLLGSTKATEMASSQVAKDISNVYGALANQLESLNEIKIAENG